MKISIITVCYNSASTIRDTLESVAAQTHPDVEHIVVDGASSDETVRIVKATQRPGGRVICEYDEGLYDAMNKGIALASGDIIGILNADDCFADADVLRRIALQFETHRVDALLGDVAFVNPEARDRLRRRYDSSVFAPALLRWGIMPAHPGMFLTRKAYQTVGSYRTDYRIASDFEFIVRAFYVHRLSYRHMPEILVKMRPGGLSTAGLRSKSIINREVMRACKENGLYTNFAMISTKYLYKILGYIK